MSTQRLVLLTTILVGIGCGATAIWAGAYGLDLGAVANTFIGMGIGQLAILVKSPLNGKGS